MIYSEACFQFVMEQENFSLQYKSWVYAYYYVLSNEFLCDKFLLNKLHFVNFHLHPDERYYWKPADLNLPELNDEKTFVEFWGGVKNWCTMVLRNLHYNLTFEGPSTGGGVGIVATNSCSSDVLQQELMGLLQDCTLEQSKALRSVFHLGSLYQSRSKSKKHLVQILYGPASLLNNDNASPFTFLDHKYLSNKPVMWRIPKQRVVGTTKWEVTVLKTVRGLAVWHSPDFDVYYQAGEQVFVNYQDPNFVDLTHDSSDEDNVYNCPTTPHKRARRDSFLCQLDGTLSAAAAHRCVSGSSSSSSNSANNSGSSFDFGTSSSSQRSNGSDSTYTSSV